MPPHRLNNNFLINVSFFQCFNSWSGKRKGMLPVKECVPLVAEMEAED